MTNRLNRRGFFMSLAGVALAAAVPLPIGLGPRWTSAPISVGATWEGVNWYCILRSKLVNEPKDYPVGQNALVRVIPNDHALAPIRPSDKA